MGRGRQHSGAEGTAPAAGFYEAKLAVKPNVVQDAKALVEIQEIIAAAQQDVLAVVYSLSAGFGVEFVRGCATA